MSASEPLVCPLYIGGKWVNPGVKAGSPVFNPSRGSTIATVPMCGVKEVNDAVASAKAAFPGWRETPPNERAQVLFRVKIMLEDAFEELCLGIATEHGKTLSEARGDLRRGIEVVEYACGVPTLLMGESLENIARGIDCHTDRHPLGVVAGICPFNFPALVPMWMWPIAIACGNTFILKPSEKVPLTMQRVVALLEKAGLPPGVINIVHGGRECVDAILEHPDVKAISFVGSTPVARDFEKLAEKHSIIGQVRGKGLMLGIELVKDRATKEPAREECAEVFERCKDLGLLIGKGGLWGNTLRIKPPMCIHQADADFMLEVLDEALAGV